MGFFVVRLQDGWMIGVMIQFIKLIFFNYSIGDNYHPGNLSLTHHRVLPTEVSRII